jgi:hypothetical protein
MYKKIIMMIIGCILFSALALAENFENLDRKKILNIAPDVDKLLDVPDNNISARVPEYFRKPIPISVTIVINKISNIDEADEHFIASIDFKLIWKDSSLSFMPSKLGTTRLEYSHNNAKKILKDIWNPHVIITNIIGEPSNLESYLWINNDGTVTYGERINATFSNKFNLDPFPFDKQELSFQLSSNLYDETQLSFIQNRYDLINSGLREGMKLQGWLFDDVKFQRSTLRGQNGKYYPQFTANVYAFRNANDHLMVLAPLFLMMLMPTMLTLYVSKTDLVTRIGSWAGALLATVAMSFTLNLRYPALGSESIISLMLQYCFAYQFIMICITCTLLNPKLIKRFHNHFLVQEINKYLKWSVPLIFILVIIARVLMTAWG